MKKSPICTKKEHDKLTDLKFHSEIGLIFVPPNML